ncbi:MAG: hypothetical protein IPP49_18800 [Saprospiraceae bacterium]|nr:hypothetical protein [Saprospiraceae bacterium]
MISRKIRLQIFTIGFLLLGISGGPMCIAQKQAPTWNIGIEADVLPYITGGYFGALWVGRGKWRSRILTADVYKPDWSTKKGFSNHHITAYALVVDRFLYEGWKGWWVSGGPVLWNGRIATSEFKTNPTSFTNILVNGSIGHHFFVYKNFYISPWAGISLNVAGDKNIKVVDKIYNLPFLNPEMSLKLGIFL